MYLQAYGDGSFQLDLSGGPGGGCKGWSHHSLVDCMCACGYPPEYQEWYRPWWPCTYTGALVADPRTCPDQAEFQETKVIPEQEFSKEL